MAILKKDEGMMFDEAKYKIVKKTGKKGDVIEKHNHPEANVLFTVISGKYSVLINDKDEYILESGMVLSFDGDNFISAKYLEDSEVIVSLILK